MKELNSVAKINQLYKKSESVTHKEGIVLPQNWKKALQLIELISKETEIKYAIIGSLGIAATCKIPWTPINPITKKVVDLDVFIMGDSSQKKLFHSKIIEETTDEMPLIDSEMKFGSHIIFEDGKIWIKHKKLHIKTNLNTFKTINCEINDISFPTLNPQTYLAMLKAYNREYSIKIKKRVEDLSETINNKSSEFELLNKNDLESLRKLKNSFELNHKMKHIKRKIAKLKSNNSIAKTVNGVRKNFPKLWKILHELSSEE